METLSAWLAMGGYGGFVWPAYGLALVVLSAVLLLSLRRVRTLEAELEALQGALRGRRDDKAQGDGSGT